MTDRYRARSQTRQSSNFESCVIMVILFKLWGVTTNPFLLRTPSFRNFLRGNPHSAELINLDFQPLELVCRYRDPQLQVAENDSYFV